MTNRQKFSRTLAEINITGTKRDIFMNLFDMFYPEVQLEEAFCDHGNATHARLSKCKATSECGGWIPKDGPAIEGCEIAVISSIESNPNPNIVMGPLARPENN